MKLYHASPFIIELADVYHSCDHLDFGKGFYLTSLYDQARKYAMRFLLKKQKAYIAFCFLLTYDAQIIRNVLHGHITDTSIMLLFAIFLLQSSSEQIIIVLVRIHIGCFV